MSNIINLSFQFFLIIKNEKSKFSYFKFLENSQIRTSSVKLKDQS